MWRHRINTPSSSQCHHITSGRAARHTTDRRNEKRYMITIPRRMPTPHPGMAARPSRTRHTTTCRQECAADRQSDHTTRGAPSGPTDLSQSVSQSLSGLMWSSCSSSAVRSSTVSASSWFSSPVTADRVAVRSRWARSTSRRDSRLQQLARTERVSAVIKAGWVEVNGYGRSHDQRWKVCS